MGQPNTTNEFIKLDIENDDVSEVVSELDRSSLSEPSGKLNCEKSFESKFQEAAASSAINALWRTDAFETRPPVAATRSTASMDKNAAYNCCEKAIAEKNSCIASMQSEHREEKQKYEIQIYQMETQINKLKKINKSLVNRCSYVENKKTKLETNILELKKSYDDESIANALEVIVYMAMHKFKTKKKACD